MQGKYDDSEKLYVEALSIRKKILGAEHPDYALSCNNLASIYSKKKEYEKAEKLYLEAYLIRKKILGEKHPSYSNSCNNLAFIYKKMGKYDEAEKFYKEAIENRKKYLGKEHPSYATSCKNLANLYQHQGRYKEAENLYLEALRIREKVLGENHPNYSILCGNLAYFYLELNIYEQAEKFIRKSTDGIIYNIKRNFIGLSEKEKEQYMMTFMDDFEKCYSFTLKLQRTELVAWLLENNLITKGLLFFSTNQLRRSLEKSQDKNLKETYEKWLEARKELSKAYEMGEMKRQEKKIDLQSLESKANELEKTLSLILSQNGIEAELTPQPRSWQEIKNKLQENEALVELTRIRYYDKKWTDSVLYVALIVKKDSPYPEMVVFPNGNAMEKEDIHFYRNSIRLRKQDKESYKVFFQPLQKALKGIKKVYFSGDGIYHQINLATLYNPENKKFLGEELDIQVISTARDFLILGKKELQSYTENYRLSLFGYPDFSGEKTKNAQGTDRAITDVALVSRIDKKQRFFDELSGTITYLPGTRKEVETIQNIAQKAQTRTEVYLEEKASEENLKAISSPAILHIATHGFFIKGNEDNKNNIQEENDFFDNPLLRSGLLLAGVELTLNKKETGSKENGILTAQEAMNLDLQGTDLVVLSACETGLGEIRNGEGVFGLQRALQEAGAKSVLMSLWKVDDAATQEMMTLFYENMLLKKQNKRTAFQNAQETMKKKYKEPYYWGAFVMVGE
jgi:CHAT domain-containing protein